ncbi:HAD family hydrolase [Alicycliphilus denitrificans]|uniref:HAD family hydrolase n=1 Tax=Alicycliphilus denitrificans TaxID=179636 RepID=UPI00384B3A0A
MSLFANVRAVLFDLDGTLIDSAPDLGAAADRLRTDRGLESLPLRAYRPMAGAGARGMLSVAFGITPEHPDFPHLREEFFANYERCIHERTDVFAGVPELVATLMQHSLQWGVVTNKISRFTLLIAQRVALFGGAGVIVSGDSTPYSKPHPAPLLAAAERLGVEPRECIYVGDDERDIQAGRAAGMGTIAAMYGYLGTGGHPAGWGADAMIYSPLELLKFMESD